MARTSIQIVRPYVRIILVNYDGGDVTTRCIESLHHLDYPQDRYEIVMVDNASIDGVIWLVRERFPKVRIIESLTNEGFARGNNLAMTDLEGIDVVALINNDAIADHNWLSELVDPLWTDPSIAITTSKMLFNRNVVGLYLSPTEGQLHLFGLKVNGSDVLSRTVFDERWSRSVVAPPSIPTNKSSELLSTAGGASFSVDADDLSGAITVSICVAAAKITDVRVIGPGVDRSLPIGIHPTWVDIQTSKTGRLINSGGGGIFAKLHGGDIGFKELDLGQFDKPRDVFSFCGGAAALRTDVLRRVGTFDPTFFLYYEDLDLSWRTRFQGYRIRYVPTAVVFHEHAYSSGEWSPFFRFWVDRNRRLTLIKNAPSRVAAKALFGAIMWGLRDSFLPTAKSILRFERPQWRVARHRLRQLGSFLKAVPAALAFRRQQMKQTAIAPEFVYDWISTRFEAECSQPQVESDANVEA